MSDKRWTAFCTVVVIVILALLYTGKKRCEHRGGAYVRGVLWMTCVTPAGEARP